MNPKSSQFTSTILVLLSSMLTSQVMGIAHNVIHPLGMRTAFNHEYQIRHHGCPQLKSSFLGKIQLSSQLGFNQLADFLLQPFDRLCGRISIDTQIEAKKKRSNFNNRVDLWI